MSLADAVQTLNLIKEDRDTVRLQLSTRDEEVEHLKQHIALLKAANNNNGSTYYTTTNTTTRPACKCQEAIEEATAKLVLATIKFEERFDAMIRRLDECEFQVPKASSQSPDKTTIAAKQTPITGTAAAVTSLSSNSVRKSSSELDNSRKLMKHKLLVANNSRNIKNHHHHNNHNDGRNASGVTTATTTTAQDHASHAAATAPLDDASSVVSTRTTNTTVESMTTASLSSNIGNTYNDKQPTTQPTPSSVGGAGGSRKARLSKAMQNKNSNSGTTTSTSMRTMRSSPPITPPRNIIRSNYTALTERSSPSIKSVNSLLTTTNSMDHNTCNADAQSETGSYTSAVSAFTESSNMGLSSPWQEVVTFGDAPAFDIDSPVVFQHLSKWSPNVEKRLYLCEWIQQIMDDDGLSPKFEDLLLRGLTTEAKESFLVILVPLLREKRSDIPLYAYCRQSSLSIGTREIDKGSNSLDDGANSEELWDMKLTNVKDLRAISESGEKQKPASSPPRSKRIPSKAMIISSSSSLKRSEKSFTGNNTVPAKAKVHKSKEDLSVTPPRIKKSYNSVSGSPSRTKSSVARKSSSLTEDPSSRKETSSWFESGDMIDGDGFLTTSASATFAAEDRQVDMELKSIGSSSSSISDRKKVKNLNKEIALTNRIQATLRTIQNSRAEI